VHLIEVERRRLHLGLGYPSMFDYCTRHLGYSSSAASRRIQTARCVRDYPEVYALLEKNEVNLVTVSLVASMLSESNAKDLIAKIRGKSQREVEAIVATYRPLISMRDRAKPVCVAVSGPRACQLNGPRGDLTPTAGSEISPNMVAADSVGGQAQASTAAASSADATAADFVGGPSEASAEFQALRKSSTLPSDEHPPSGARFERKFLVQFLASPRFMKKFEKAKALLSNKNGKPSYEFVLEAALDEFLKDHDPENREQRREERKEKANAKSKPTKGGHNGVFGRRDAERVAQSCERPGPSRHVPTAALCRGTEASRYIPAATRDAVFARDKGRCTFVGSTGKRCDATHNLQIDHILPYARSGAATLDNLRLLCGRHNKHEAERVLGANTVRRFRRRE
jgi:5-methylcytosine-specific restriction endonuclease McrA